MTDAHGTTTNIVRHLIGAVVSHTSRRGLASVCPIRIKRIEIPR